MTSTTNLNFSQTTTATEVAASFPASIKSRNILITGVNRKGIGYTTAAAFASQGSSCLILAGRSETKIQECIDALRETYPNVKVKPLIVDLASIKSVKAAAETVMSWGDVPQIDIVVNNAGLMRHGEHFDGPMPVSVDGIEDQFATNHLGHWLLTTSVMPKVIAAAEGQPKGAVRVINLSSSGTWVSPFRASDIAWEKPAAELPENERPNFAMMKGAGIPIDESVPYIPTAAYGASKTCNVLFSVGLNERFYHKYGILSLALNPGEVKTELGRNTDPEWLKRAVQKMEEAGMLFWKSQDQGASTTLVAACDPALTLPGEDGHGYMLSDCQIWKAPPWGLSKEAADRLWKISEKIRDRLAQE